MQRITGSLDEGRITFGARRSEEPVRDPVCGMMVEPSRAAAACVHEGQSYFFCSERCKALFEADPQKYLPHDEPAREPPGNTR